MHDVLHFVGEHLNTVFAMYELVVFLADRVRSRQVSNTDTRRSLATRGSPPLMSERNRLLGQARDCRCG